MDKDKRGQQAREYYVRNREIILARRKEHYKQNKERVLVRNAARYEEHKEEINARRRANHAANPTANRERGREYYAANRVLIRQRDRERKFGVTPEEWQEMYERQQGICPICSTPVDDGAAVDHDHTTGKVRGLLHSRCNLGIGVLGDSADNLLRAYQYLTASSLDAAA